MNSIADLKARVTSLKLLIDDLQYTFFDEGNKEEFQNELDSAAVSLDEAIEIIERDAAYRDVKHQM